MQPHSWRVWAIDTAGNVQIGDWRIINYTHETITRQLRRQRADVTHAWTGIFAALAFAVACDARSP